MGVFWKKSKPTPWYKKLWNKLETAVYTIGAIVTAVGSFVTFISIDTTGFERTTSSLAVAANDKIYVTVENVVEIPELTYIIVSVEGQQLTHQVYPEGLLRGKHVLEAPIPFNISDKVLDLDIDIIFSGPRTIFLPERLNLRQTVEVQ